MPCHWLFLSTQFLRDLDFRGPRIVRLRFSTVAAGFSGIGDSTLEFHFTPHYFGFFSPFGAQACGILCALVGGCFGEEGDTILAVVLAAFQALGFGGVVQFYFRWAPSTLPICGFT